MADAFVGEIRLLPYIYTPLDWLDCLGQQLVIANYQELFMVIGNAFGGDGRNNFCLPNLQGAVVPGCGNDPSDDFDPRIGANGGTEMVALTDFNIPQHTHTLKGATQPSIARTNQPANNYIGQVFYQPLPSGTSDAGNAFFDNTTATPNLMPMNPGSLSAFPGGNQLHENRQPYLAMRYCICCVGIYPVRP